MCHLSDTGRRSARLSRRRLRPPPPARPTRSGLFQPRTDRAGCCASRHRPGSVRMHRARAHRRANAVAGASPTYTNRPASSRSSVFPSLTVRVRTPVNPPLPIASSTMVPKRTSIFGFSRTCWTYAACAENALPRCRTITRATCCASVNASCNAESPPPTTPTMRPRRRGASQLAQWLTPLPRSDSSPGIPSVFNVVPVAITTARAHTSPCACGHAPASVIAVQPGRLRGVELRTSPDSLLLNDRAQVVAGHAIGKAGIAVDPFDAYELAPERRAGQDPRLPPGTRRRQACGQARHTTSSNHDIVFVVRHPILRLATPRSGQARILAPSRASPSPPGPAGACDC